MKLIDLQTFMQGEIGPERMAKIWLLLNKAKFNHMSTAEQLATLRQAKEMLDKEIDGLIALSDVITTHAEKIVLDTPIFQLTQNTNEQKLSSNGQAARRTTDH